MNRPKLTEAQAKEIIKNAPVQPTEAVMILAIRGYYLDSMGKDGENDRGVYDDAIFLIAPNYFQAFNANTDPSKFKTGIAKLTLGLHYFKKGKHGLSKKNPYDAFRPATPDESLPVTRDGQTGITKGIAINIHSGGINTTSSEGCQTIYKDQWKEFQTKAYELMTKEGQTKIPYLLVENINNTHYDYTT